MRVRAVIGLGDEAGYRGRDRAVELQPKPMSSSAAAALTPAEKIGDERLRKRRGAGVSRVPRMSDATKSLIG